MIKLKNNEKGFGGVVVLLIVVVVVLIGVIGYMVYKNNHKTTIVKTATITRTTSKKPTQKRSNDPYAGWKTYILPIEKMSFKYPSNWLLTNDPPAPTQDNIVIASSDGFNFIIEDGISNGGDPRPQDANMPIPVKFLGQSDYFVFGYARITNSPGYSNTNIDWGNLQINPKDETSLLSDKTAVGPNDTTGALNAKYFSISGNFGTSPPSLTIKQAQSNEDFKNALLIIQSMHY